MHFETFPSSLLLIRACIFCGGIKPCCFVMVVAVIISAAAASTIAWTFLVVVDVAIESPDRERQVSRTSAQNKLLREGDSIGCGYCRASWGLRLNWTLLVSFFWRIKRQCPRLAGYRRAPVPRSPRKTFGQTTFSLQRQEQCIYNITYILHSEKSKNANTRSSSSSSCVAAEEWLSFAII